MYLTCHSKLSSSLFHTNIKPISDHLLSLLVLNPPQFIHWQSVAGGYRPVVGPVFDAVLHCAGHQPETHCQDRQHLPGLFSLHYLPFCRFQYRENMNHSCNSLNAPWNNESLLLERSSFILPKASYPDCNPLPFPVWGFIYFNHKQIRHTYRAPVLIAATSPGTSPLPIYSIWC